MQRTDPSALNVPLLLTTRVLVMDDSGQMVPDTEWHTRVLDRIRSLYEFHIENDLLAPGTTPVDTSPDKLIIRHSNLTDMGLALWQSGAVHRWLNSFDRSPSKIVTNRKSLEAALLKVGGVLPNNSFKGKPLRGSP